ncbi:MAG: ABC transporter ATP-binding protein [Planctomycetes bacterium]|nr:ABC transporter ATP-binding protein [Planctomycetota bacterium]
MVRIQEIADAEYALEVQNLSYRFKSHKALDGMSFRVRPGSIHGFVGPNGAGKTTTLKIVSTLLLPERDRVSVFGMDVVRQQKKVRRFTGFMPDSFAMYRPMTVFEYLDFFAAAYGQALAERNNTIRDVLALTDMTGRKNDLIKGLSRGMQQRVCLARVLVHDPELLLLDEPASGLDPRARIELMEILRELRSLGKTIFISSHILSELAALCDEVTIVDRGSVKYSGSMSELLVSAGNGQCEYELVLGQQLEHMPALAEMVPEVATVRPVEEATAPTWRVLFDAVDPDTGPLLQAVIQRGGRVVALRRVQRQLDEVFLDLTEPGVRT